MGVFWAGVARPNTPTCPLNCVTPTFENIDFMDITNTNSYTSLVSRIMRIESIIHGDPQNRFIAKYQGEIYNEDTSAAYEEIADTLRPLDVTPLFRIENGKHTVILTPGVIHPKPSNPRVNLVLFLLTVFSTFLVGAAYAYEGPPPTTTFDLFILPLKNFFTGWPFAASILSILLAHEFGHYLAARFHHTEATLPYFLPLPVPGTFGTLGAVIVQKEAHKNRRILLDIGIAGPLAGLVVAIPILILGLSLSEINRLPINFNPNTGLVLEGNSILYLLVKYAVFHEWLPTPISFRGLPPLLYWVIYFFTGFPTPMGGRDVTLHQVAWAGWAGLLVTALNLIPVGQFDGGHILHGLFGKHAAKIRPTIMVVLIILGVVWSGWFIWVLLIFVFGRSYAEPLDQITPLDIRRKALGLLGLIIFLLVFTPVPMRAVTASFVP
jgi:membrane-associated protease RseP (regulator of RpoE activity)